MTKNNITEAEIMKSFELCFAEKGSTYTCGVCPYHKFGELCKVERDKDVINLINRKNAKIRKLNFENLQMVASIKGLRAEAIKEYIEKVKEKIGFDCSFVDVYEIIDQIAKEMGV